jgi:hypothetical protein
MARQKIISLDMDCQNAEFWCWAAVSQSISRLKGIPRTQEQIASNHVGEVCVTTASQDSNSACGEHCVGTCNSPHRLSRVLEDEGHKANAIEISTLSFQEIVDEIDRGEPLPLRINITTGSRGGHFICVTGYLDGGDGNEFVVIFDPLVPGLRGGSATSRTIPFDALAMNYKVNGDSGTPNFKYELS